MKIKRSGTQVVSAPLLWSIVEVAIGYPFG
jgi:hypothetical protein